MTSKPKAVLLSDVHYSLPTLALADAATRQAIAKANELNVPLIIAGDLHDSKANLRGECVNAMLTTFKLTKTPTYILCGNHDLINEKSSDTSLEFLSEIINLVRAPRTVGSGLRLLPYRSDLSLLRSELADIPLSSTLIMHQGLNGSNMGDYVQDKSALSHADVADFRVISGHYHARQDIDTGKGNKFSYIGNPYTLTFGEANDPEKGFQILMDDGILEFVPTNLRKHVVYDVDFNSIVHQDNVKHRHGDLIWVKVRGRKDELITLTRASIAYKYLILGDFKLDLIPTDSNIQAPVQARSLSKEALLDSLIDSANSSDEQKSRLKALWRTKHG